MEEQFSPLSIRLTQLLTKREKKQFGIFITPRVIIKQVVDFVKQYTVHNGITIQSIMEPSCGTCEIVSYCDECFDNVRIRAIELNATLFEAVKVICYKNNVTILNEDFIQHETATKYDLIIGNPPYFVCDTTYKVALQHAQHINGRPNIFGLFILHAISMLAPNGIVAFIIPRSFLNSASYSKIRNHIKETCTILTIIDFEKDNKFIDTEQATFAIVFKRESSRKIQSIKECHFSIKLGNDFMFTSNSTFLHTIFEGSTTLKKLGLSVRTGQVVWNQHKDKLTEDPEGTVLLYDSNVTRHHSIELKTFKNVEKKQYIKMDGRMDTILVVSRGHGNSKYKLEYALIDFAPYLTENHLNEIYSKKAMEKGDLIELLHQVTASFSNPKTQLFIDTFLGNNGLSKTELETIFPIYI
jgi:adenine-specific DNA-methyltransferase